MSDPPPIHEPETTATFESWRDDVGKVWNGITGKRTVWAFGQPVKVTFYPRLAFLARILTLTMLGIICWKVWQIAENVLILSLRESVK